MMKKLLLLSFFLIQTSLYAQEKGQWGFGIEFSVDKMDLAMDRFHNNYLVTDGNVNGYGVDFDQFNFSLGLSSQYHIQKKLSLSSGILFSNKDFSGTYSCASCLTQFRLFYPEVVLVKQQFLTIPLSINYSLLTGRLRPVLTGGFRNNIEVKNDLDELSNGYFLEGFLGAGIYYALAEKLDAGIGYRYLTALSDLYKTDDFNLRSNSIFLQVNYSLR
ncbi:outer membrane beta-barrel protein [Echinicola sp. 20G]|uniref:outer membrane beta-barrel protein n=1 Tax=Echinicola sp. 20G TaxID=2781961 RepID=UPI001910C3F6|nr:outer membrane beta-barrel protein [Echinicola sp. 20G]